MKNNNLYEQSKPFLEVYPEFDIATLPYWVRENIQLARITGKKNRTIIMPDEKKYYLDNKLNHLSGQEWTYFINSVFTTYFVTSGKDGDAHSIRKIHPTPKPPKLMKELILFFTKENEIVFDSFMGVGGTLLGAGLCNRKAFGIDLNPTYIDAYHKAAKEMNVPDFKTVCADSIEFLSDENNIRNLIGDEKISLLLIDPPYCNMMSKEKTGADISIYGKNATPFTNSEKDLGNMQIKDFLESLAKSIKLILPNIKLDGHVVVFMKDLQPKGKTLNLLHYDVINELNKIDNLYYKGMKIWADGTAKLYPYGYPFSFVANQVHQYILIFRKEKD